MNLFILLFNIQFILNILTAIEGLEEHSETEKPKTNSKEDFWNSTRFRGAISTYGNKLTIFVDAYNDNDLVLELYQSQLAWSNVSVCKLGDVLGKAPKKIVEHSLWNTQMDRKLITPYDTIALINAPGQNDVFLHFYKNRQDDRVILFTEKIPLDDTASAQTVAPQLFTETTYGLFTYVSGDKTHIVMASHTDEDISLKFGHLSVRGVNPAGYNEMYINMEPGFRRLTINKVTMIVTAHPVNHIPELKGKDQSLKKYFGQSTDKFRAFYHNGFIYIIPSVNSAGMFGIVFTAVPKMLSYQKGDTFESPFRRYTIGQFWGHASAQRFPLPNLDFRIKKQSDSGSTTIKILIGLGIFALACFIGHMTGCLDFKAVDRRVFFADDFIRKMNQKDKKNQLKSKVKGRRGK